MIPWFESTILFSVGPFHVRTWGTLVALGFLTATWIAARRAKEKHLDSKMVWDMAFWIFISAIIGSRLFHAVFYEPVYYLAHPLAIFDPTAPGFAIMGGILFGAGAAFLFARTKKLDFIAYADTLAWGLPWGCGIGRIGCFLIHDHPGTLTHFILGLKQPDGNVRHDLGLYLSIVGFLMGIVFLLTNRFAKKLRNAPGFWVGLFFVLDGIARFLLDFLRVVDRRIVGLTPTQWLLIPTTCIGLWLVYHALIKVTSPPPAGGSSQ